jgi:type IV pilus assembly protein PilO
MAADTNSSASFDLNNPATAYMVFVLLIVLGGGYAFYEYVVLTKKESIAQLETSNSAKENQLAELNRELAGKQSLEQELIVSEQELQQLRSMFPSSEQVVNRLRDLYGSVVASGVEIHKFQPMAVEVKPLDSTQLNDPRMYYNENYYSIEMVGGYHMLGQLFAEVANMHNPTSIINLKATPVEDLDQQVVKFNEQGWQPKSVRLSFQLTTYTSRK